MADQSRSSLSSFTRGKNVWRNETDELDSGIGGLKRQDVEGLENDSELKVKYREPDERTKDLTHEIQKMRLDLTKLQARMENREEEFETDRQQFMAELRFQEEIQSELFRQTMEKSTEIQNRIATELLEIKNKFQQANQRIAEVVSTNRNLQAELVQSRSYSVLLGVSLGMSIAMAPTPSTPQSSHKQSDDMLQGAMETIRQMQHKLDKLTNVDGLRLGSTMRIVTAAQVSRSISTEAGCTVEFSNHSSSRLTQPRYWIHPNHGAVHQPMPDRVDMRSREIFSFSGGKHNACVIGLWATVMLAYRVEETGLELVVILQSSSNPQGPNRFALALTSSTPGFTRPMLDQALSSGHWNANGQKSFTNAVDGQIEIKSGALAVKGMMTLDWKSILMVELRNVQD